MQGDLATLLRGPFREGADDAPEPAPVLDGSPPRAEAAPEGEVPRIGMRLSGDHMGAWQRAWQTARHLFQVGRRRYQDARATEGGMVGSALRWHGPSIEDQSAYARSRAWTPPGHAGGLVEAMGVIFHTAIGRPAAAIGNAIKWLGCWPLHFTVTAVAGSAAWWGLHAALGLPGGTRPLIVTGILLGAWLASALILVTVQDHRQGDPSRYGPPGDSGQHSDGAYPDGYDDEDYPR
jgi:hypothetical protein